METEPDTFDCQFGIPKLEVPECFRTLQRIFKFQYRNHQNRRCLGSREYMHGNQRGRYEWYSYKEVTVLANLLAMSFEDLGIKKGDRIGVISSNKIEWSILDVACSIYGAVLVPLYDSQS